MTFGFFVIEQNTLTKFEHIRVDKLILVFFVVSGIKFKIDASIKILFQNF